MYCHLEMEGEFAYLPLFVADFANAAQTISKVNRVVGVAIEEQLGVVFCTWLLLACSFSAPFSSRSQYAYLHAKARGGFVTFLFFGHRCSLLAARVTIAVLLQYLK